MFVILFSILSFIWDPKVYTFSKKRRKERESSIREAVQLGNRELGGRGNVQARGAGHVNCVAAAGMERPLETGSS